MSVEVVDQPSKGRTAQVFDRIAEHFDLTRRSPWQEVVQYIESMESMDVAADIGCGNGRHIPYLSEKAEKVLAVDFSSEMLSMARKNMEEAELRAEVVFLLADSALLPVEKASLGGFIYIAALHHLPTEEERMESLRSLKESLRTGSRGIISVWALEQPRFADLAEAAEEGDILVPWTMPDGRKYDRFYHLFLKDEFRSIIERSGLAVEKLYRSRDNFFAEVINH
jgi:ubiquinone/menaquinone biosynthesis C-methylase UbiE